MTGQVNRFIKAMRADISALLLIAFLFQLLTPVIVLADTDQSDFQNSLRASICRVDLSTNASQQEPRHTDGFVCDLCVLCHLDSLSFHTMVSQSAFQHALPYVIERHAPPTNQRLFHQSANRTVSARAPPFV